MANRRELSLKRRRSVNRPKRLTGRGQKAPQGVAGLSYPRPWANNPAGEQREPNPSMSSVRNVVNPQPPSPPGCGGESRPQGEPMGLGVEEAGESEGRAV